MVTTMVAFGLWPSQYEELNVFKSICSNNFLCAFHKIRIFVHNVNHLPSTLQDLGCGKPTLLIAKVLSNLLVPLVFKPPIVVPFWNHHIDNYVYEVFGFANKYLIGNGVVIIFHDDSCVLKEIKLFLETNGYKIHSRWVVINILPQMSMKSRGKW
jgi:hypothetical protein